MFLSPNNYCCELYFVKSFFSSYALATVSVSGCFKLLSHKCYSSCCNSSKNKELYFDTVRDVFPAQSLVEKQSELTDRNTIKNKRKSFQLDQVPPFPTKTLETCLLGCLQLSRETMDVN